MGSSLIEMWGSVLDKILSPRSVVPNSSQKTQEGLVLPADPNIQIRVDNAGLSVIMKRLFIMEGFARNDPSGGVFAKELDALTAEMVEPGAHFQQILQFVQPLPVEVKFAQGSSLHVSTAEARGIRFGYPSQGQISYLQDDKGRDVFTLAMLHRRAMSQGPTVLGQTLVPILSLDTLALSGGLLLGEAGDKGIKALNLYFRR